jgi:hypothetical protein
MAVPNGRWFAQRSTGRVFMPLLIEPTVDGDVITAYEIPYSHRWVFAICPMSGNMRLFPEAPKVRMRVDSFFREFEQIANYTDSEDL